MNTTNFLESTKMHSEGLFPTLYDLLTSKGLDSYANFMGDDENHRDHFYLLSVGRDSRCLERSNFEVLEAKLKALGANYTIETHGHWACGWLDHLLLSFDNSPQVVREIATMVHGLNDYPILDEDHYSQLENTEVYTLWGDEVNRDRVGFCKAAGISIFAARSEYVPDEVYEYLSCDL